MKTLSCQDMGVECDYIAKGSTEEEVVKMGMEHAQKEHPDKVKEMMAEMTPEEMTEEVKSKVKEE